MATKIFGSCSGNSGNKYDIWFEINENSHSITNNTSNLSVKIKLKRNDGYSASAYNLNENDNYVNFTINGVQKSSRYLAVDTRNSAEVLLLSWQGDVTHNNDGTLKITLGAVFTMKGTSLAGGEVSGDFVCVSIPRISDFTLSTSSVNPETDVKVTVVPYASATFSHKLKYQLGNYNKTVNLNVGVTETTLSIPKNWANAIPNSKKGDVKLTLSTYIGEKLIGKKVKNLKLVLPETEEYLPGFITNVEYNSYGNLPGIWSVVAQNITKAKVELINKEFKFGSELSSAYIIIGGVRKEGVSAEFDLPDSGNIACKTVLTDSRGFSRVDSFIIYVDAYSKPTVACNSLYRCDETGLPNRTGKYAAIDFESFYSSIRDLNIARVKVKYKKSNETVYSDLITLSSSPYILQNEFDESSSYDFVISVTDFVTTTPFEIRRTLPSAAIPFNIKKGGKGAAFGCYAENDNELTVGYNLNVKGELNYTDLSNSVVYESCATKNEMCIKKFDCLDVTYIKAKIYVKEQISANTWTTLGRIPGMKLKQLCPIPTTIEYYIPDRVIAGIMNVEGCIRVISSVGFNVGNIIYINGVFS